MYQVIKVVAEGKGFSFDLIDEFENYDDACQFCQNWQTKGYEREPFILEREEQL